MKRNVTLCSILLLLAATLFAPVARAQANVDDSLALVDFFNSTNGPNWKTHTNWLTVRPISTWYGITVSVQTGRVAYLYLPTNGLSGVIPASIGNLTGLTYLDLYNNAISGTIPAGIANLVNLLFLNVTSNHLSGSIPAGIFNLTNLVSLNASNNQFSGSIPSAIGNLVNLGALYLDNNQLSGTIPATLGNLVQLNEIVIGNNGLRGTIPASLGKLGLLHLLYLNNNHLHGSIPVALGRLHLLGGLHLNNNQLSGEVPAVLFKLKNLYDIDLSHNRLSQNSNITAAIPAHDVRGSVNHNLFNFNGLEFIAGKFPKISYAGQVTVLSIHGHANALSVYAGGTLSNNTYTWYKAGSMDSTVIAGDSTFNPSESGMYYVKVTNTVATRLTLHSDTINFAMPLTKQSADVLIAKTTQPAAAIRHIQVYPNPAKEVIHIQTNGIANIVITNSNGKVLLTKSINNNNTAINISSFANGIYYLQNKTTGEVHKIIVVH